MSVANLASALAWVRETVPEGAELRLDSRRVEKGDVFIAVPGLKVDGRNFIKAAAEKGAGAVLIDAAPGSAEIPEGIPALEVEGLSKSLGRFASLYYGNPSGAMEGFAVTGTNGKTTTSQWMASILTELGTPCGVLGTIGCTMNGRSYSSVPLTTPDPVTLQTLLAELHRDGAKAFSIEASSIGLVQGRLDGTAISYALFTNLTRDHLDYHGTMEAYEEAKSLLFRWEGLKCSVINIDDPAGLRLCRVSLDAGVRVIAATAVGTKAPEGCELLEARDVQIGAKGIAFTLCWAGEERHVEAGVLGLFNVDNMIGAIGMMLASGRGLDDVIRVAERLAPPPGRLQKITHPGEPMGVVDYCHTPDAIEKALTTLRPVAEARGGKLWAIVGAGGNRDPGKRPIMGAIAEKLSDKLVVTSDNPRFEDPKTIAEAVAAGAHSPEIVVDRREAIQEVFSRAGAADVILVAGKGHEDYQEVCGVKHHFSDAEEVEAALQSRMAKEKEEKSE